MGPKLIDILNINILPPTLMRNSDYQIRYRWVSPILSFWGQKRDFIGLLFFFFFFCDCIFTRSCQNRTKIIKPIRGYLLLVMALSSPVSIIWYTHTIDQSL